MIQNPFRDIPVVVKNLLIINVLMFVATIIFAQSNTADLQRMLAVYYPGSYYFEPYQLITSVFMHGSIPHLFLNMFGLIIFGKVLEQIWGSKRFLIFYLLTGFFASALPFLIDYIELLIITSGKTDVTIVEDSIRNSRDWVEYSAREIENLKRIYWTPSLGASGALFGVLIAFAMLFPDRGLMLMFIPYPIKARIFVPIILAASVFFGFARLGDGIGHFAHLGGALVGFLIMLYWKKTKGSYY